MLVCEDPKFAYFMPGRTASYSIFHALQAAFPKAKDLGKHHGYVELPDCEKYCLVVSIRDPFSRAVSMWQLVAFRNASPWWGRRRHHMRRICKNGGFYAFLMDPQMREYNIYAPIRPQMEQAGFEADYLIRFETLRRDVKRLPFLQGKRLRLYHEHRSNYSRPWYEYYTPELEDAVRELYAADFEHFGYSKDLADYLPK